MVVGALRLTPHAKSLLLLVQEQLQPPASVEMELAETLDFQLPATGGDARASAGCVAGAV